MTYKVNIVQILSYLCRKNPQLDMKTFDLAVLSLGHFHGSDWNFGPICSGFSRLYLVDEGEAIIKFGGRSHRLTSGHIYLIPSLLTHTDHCDSMFGHYYIHFVDCSKRILDYFHKYDMPLQMDSTLEDLQIIKRLQSLCPNTSMKNPLPETYDNPTSMMQLIQRFKFLPLGKQMEVNALLMLLLSKFFDKAKLQENVSDQRVLKAMYQIGNNLDKTFSIDEMAEEAHLGKYRFIRLFKQQTGYTPVEYIIRQRILHAQMLFIDGNHTLKEVASLVGYKNFAYFTRTFKKVTELTPSEFIRQNK